jgi:predicted DNA-binding protein (UPF0251 family)
MFLTSPSAMCHNNYGHMTINEVETIKNPVGRPVKWRRVSSLPQVLHFKPAAVPLNMLEEVCLSVEEIEALRLKDLEGLEQEACAREMNVSRPTFQRILGSGRQKVADALVNGKAIKVEGGNFEMAFQRFKCNGGHEWDVPFEVMVKSPPQLCPTCHTPSIMPLWPQGLVRARGGWGRFRRGRGRW